MEKLNRYFPAALFLIYIGKMFLVGSTFSDAAILATLALWAGLQEIKLQTKDKAEVLAVMDELRKDFAEQRGLVQSLKNELSAFKLMRK